MSNRFHLRKRALVRRGVPLALGGLLVTGTSVAWAANGDDDPDYRTAVATLGSVEALLTRTGTVEKVTQADASFPVSGTVEKVYVAVGDTVDEGDVLAKLDRTDLKAAVNAAKATLAKAEATLESDKSGSSGSGSSGSGSSGSGSPGSGSSGPASSASGSGPGSGASGSGASGSGASGSGASGSGSGSTGGGAPGQVPGAPAPSDAVDLTAEVAAVNAAQKAATASAGAAAAALDAQKSACDAFTGDAATAAAALLHDSAPAGQESGDATTAAGSDDTPGGSGSEGPSTPTVDTAPLVECITALAAAGQAQTERAEAQDALAAADTALSTAMTAAAEKLTAAAADAATRAAAAAKEAAEAAAAAATSAVEKQAAEAAAKAAEEKGAAEKAAAEKAAAEKAAASQASSARTSTVSDAARLAVDEAAIRAAEAELADARDDYAGAVLRAPIDGVVGALPFAAGKATTSTATATVLGGGGVRVTVDVPLGAVKDLTVGTPAQVSTDGATTTSAGTVESIGILPTSTSGTAAYPVAVVVPKPAAALTEGSVANVALVLKSVTDVVTVPNSALTSSGTGATGFVTVWENGRATRRTVSYGAVGATAAEITEGLRAGETVVLADPSRDVPASSTSSTRGFGTGAMFGGPAGAVPGGAISVRR